MRRLKKTISMLLALAMVFSCFVAFAAEEDTEEAETEALTEFSDVDPKSTVGKAVSELAHRGIVTGYPDGTYGPEGNITRAEFATICVRLANLSDALGEDAVTGFTDLDADDSFKWARPYVAMAKSRGIINGYSDGNFGAGDPVTYEQAVKMLMCLANWGSTCEAMTNKTPNASWSYGYIYYANQQGLTKNAMCTEADQSKAITRGTVAILANNALTLPVLQITEEGSYVTSTTDKNGNSNTVVIGDKNTEDVISGTITGTYIASFDPDIDDIGKYDIVLDNNENKIYEVKHSILDSYNLCDLIGKTVKLTVDSKENLVTKMTVTDYESVDIYSGYVKGEKFFSDATSENSIEYITSVDTFKTANISTKGYVLFNGKLIEDFNAQDLVDPDSEYYFTSGVIQVSKGTKYNFVKIYNYKNYVVKSTSSRTSSDKINFMYLTGDNASMEFPVETDSDYFIFRRGKTDITALSQLAKWDVMSVLESPTSADGPDVKIVEVTRENISDKKVTNVSENDDTIFKIDGQYYQYNYEYKNIPEDSDDDIPTLERGVEGVNLYFDNIGQIAAVSTSTSSSSGSFAYGYLLAMEQNDSDSDYNLDLYIMGTDGNKKEYGTGTSIQIDGKKYQTRNEDITDLLEETAQQANEAYLDSDAGADVENFSCQQPIRFKVNSSTGLITALDTVAESDIDDNDLSLDAPYAGNKVTYSSSSGFSYTLGGEKISFGVGTATKVFFVPDDRTDFDEYFVTTYSKAFISGTKYHVEGYNLADGSQHKADLVMMYKTSDSESFTYKAPFLIISDFDENEDGDRYMVGYKGTASSVSTSASTTVYLNDKKLSDEAEEVYENLGKGDIVRYIEGADGKAIDLQLWLDASDPVQGQSVGTIEEALANRILAIDSTSPDPIEGDKYNASFRLAYGTVLSHDTIDDVIVVSPTIIEDEEEQGLEMATNGTGVVAHRYSTSVAKVFVYNRKTGAEYISENPFDEIQDYDNAGDAASVVVTLTSGNSTTSSSYLKMVYIIL